MCRHSERDSFKINRELMVENMIILCICFENVSAVQCIFLFYLWLLLHCSVHLIRGRGIYRSDYWLLLQRLVRIIRVLVKFVSEYSVYVTRLCIGRPMYHFVDISSRRTGLTILASHSVS